jgi:hypothetical protein
MQQGALNTNKLQSAVLVLEHLLAHPNQNVFWYIPLTNAEGESSIEDIWKR